MHVKRVSVPKKAITIDCDWLEENLPDSLFELVEMIISFIKGRKD